MIFITEVENRAAGIRLAVKDLFDTAGMRTTYGSSIFSDHVPDTTASAVSLLESAGYATVGKANLHEFAYGITSQNAHYGTVPNPIAPRRLAGGSSGGSAAALAAGLADAALGTDSGGSIRIPASWCGVVGFKPTHGLVPIDGCFPLAPSFDHAGPMARSVAECRAMLGALAPAAEAAGPSAPTEAESLADLCVGLAWAHLADPLVKARVEAAAAHFGHVERIDMPLAQQLGPVFMREVADVHRELFAQHGDEYGENVRVKVERCLAVSDDEFARATAERELYRERCLTAIQGLDLLVTPTTAFVAPSDELDDLALRDATIRFTFPVNALGWPALALPCGPAEHGLPASAQIVGRPAADTLVLAAGELLEAALA
jgi:aspartyl-tRNA(Asn)/glutamyl-tRNA(Gln) amidotransferase subunit A